VEGCLEAVPAPQGAECLGAHQLPPGHHYSGPQITLVVFLAAVTTTSLLVLAVLALHPLRGVFSVLSHLPPLQGAYSVVVPPTPVVVCSDPPIATHLVGACLDPRVLEVAGFLDQALTQVVAYLDHLLTLTLVAVFLGTKAVPVGDFSGAATTPVEGCSGAVTTTPVEGCLEAATTAVEAFLEVPSTALGAVYLETIAQVVGCSETANPPVSLGVQITVVEAYLETRITAEEDFSVAATNPRASSEIPRQTTTTTTRILV